MNTRNCCKCVGAEVSRPLARTILLFGLLAGAVHVSAQTVVVPDELAGADAAFGSGTLFNVAHRSQQVYAAGEFGTVTGALLITELRLRPDYYYGNSFSTTVSNIQINLSTTKRSPEGLSGTFIDNVGLDDKMVFSGALGVSSSFSGPAGGPKAFDIILPFNSGFVYNPAAGNLLVDIRNFSGSSASLVAGQGANGDGASRVLGGVNSGGGVPDNGADALLVVYSPTNAPPILPPPPPPPQPSGFVVPNELANADSAFGSGTLYNIGHRSQQVYAASEFGSVTGALLITELRLRPDYYYGREFSATLADFRVNLSTTQKMPEGLSGTFAENVGADDVNVFAGALGVSSSFSGPGSGPKTFDIRIPLTTPFLYYPSAGNLLIDIKNASGSGASLVAGQGVNGDGASRVLGGVNSSNGAPDNGADVFLIVVSGGPAGTNEPPTILAQPQSQAVLEGATVSFSVVASGTPEFSYQWIHGEMPLPDATNSMLSLANVALSDAGSYLVVVTNAFGSVTSQVATLTVTQPPASVRVVGGNGAGGVEVNVPIQIRANGNENAIGFSLNFNTSVLAFSGVTLGSGVHAGASLLLNTNEAASGRIGLGVGLPADSTLELGTQEVVVVTFLVGQVVNQTTTPITFGDAPTLRQLSDRNARELPAVFSPGSVSISDSEVEGDLAPRPVGNRAVAIVDWVQMGRFVALLDTVSNASEFQRADCAPRSTRGNGTLGASDWVQVGRYAVGLDPITVAAGPTAPEGGGGGGFVPASSGSILSVRNSSIAQSQTNTVPVMIECKGGENAMTFSVWFDSAKLEYVSAGTGSATVGAALNLNVSQAAAGRIGVALALQPGTSLSSGPREILQIRFAALATAPSSVAVTFGSDPVPKEVSDAQANTLPASYVPGTVTVTSPPGPPLLITRSSISVIISWPSSGSAGFELEATAGAIDSPWSSVPGVIDLGLQKLVIIPSSGGERYFRLKKP